MRRRDLLGSVAGALTAASAGLAGCSTANDEPLPPTETSSDTGDCVPPSERPADALPPTGDAGFERQGDVTVSESSHDTGVERTAYALYRGPDGNEYYCSVTAFDSPTAADEGTETQRRQASHDNAVLGLVQFDRYVYFGAGPDRETVRSLLAQSALSEACLAREFLVLAGTASPEPL